jgi:DNA-directed RNA polymerase subunit H (RpoH/RPB5)
MIKSIEQTPLPKIEEQDPPVDAEANEEEILVQTMA